MPHRRIPSLNWLRVFEAAARTQSFSRAADVLAMTPAAVSQQIKALEGHLGTRLFERQARGVVLTDAGGAFLPVVRQALLSVETTAASLFGHSRRTPLTVQATLILATAWLAPRLPAFTARHPDIEVHLIGAHSEADTNRDDAELLIVHGGVPPARGDSDRLMGERIHAVALPALARDIASPADLTRHRLIEISAHRTGWMRLLGEAADVDLAETSFCFSDSTQIALALAAAGHGVALARAPATDDLVASYGLVRVLPELEVESGESYHLVYRSAASLSPAARRFRTWLLEASAACR